MLIEGMAFFKKDRMIARLNGDETRAWLLAQGKITKRTYIQMTESKQNTVVFQSLSQSRKLNIDISRQSNQRYAQYPYLRRRYRDVRHKGSFATEKPSEGGRTAGSNNQESN